MFLSVSIPDIIQYTNYAFIAILVLGALIGFGRGMFKSIYYLVIFVAMALLSWFVIAPAIINSLLDWELNRNLFGVYVTSLRESMPQIMGAINEDYAVLMEEGTETYTLVLGVVTMIVKIGFTISMIILTMTGLKLIFGLIYLIIAPRSKDKNGNKVKKTFGSRFGGMIIGTVHAFLLLLLLSIPISGISQIGNEISKIEESKTEEVEYKVINDGNKLILLSNTKELDSVSSTLDKISPYFSVYRSSIYGKIFSKIQVSSRPVDEKLFDTVLTVDYNDKKISLSNDIVMGMEIYNSLKDEIDGKWTLEAILSVDSDKLKEAAQKLGDLNLINAIVPITAEVILKTDIIKGDFAETLKSVDADKIISDLKKINLNDDVVNLGMSLISLGKSGIIEITKAGKEDEDGNKITLIEILNKLDSDLVTEGFEKIGGVEIFNVVGDIGLRYLATAKFMEKYLESAGMTSNDIDFNGVKLNDNLANLGNVIVAIQGLNMSQEDLKKIDLSKYSDSQTDALVDALYSLSLLSHNTELLAAVVREEFLPEEYRVLLPRREMKSADMKGVIKIAKVMLTGENIVSGNISMDTLLNKDNIEVIVQEAHNSEYINDMINGAGTVLIDTICSNLNIPSDEFNVEGINWADELEPLSNLVTIAGDLGISFTGGSTSLSFEELTDEQISDFANAVFESNVMSQNTELILSLVRKYVPESYANLIPKSLGSAKEFESFLKIAKTASKTTTGGQIDLSKLDTDELADAVSGLTGEQVTSLITGIIDTTGLIDTTTLNLPEIDTSTEEGVQEVQKLLEAVDTISSVSSVSDLKDLAGDEIENITSSKFATTVVVELLTQETQEGGSLNGFLVLDGISDDEWVDTEEGSGELKKLVDATNVLMDDSGNVDMSVEKISSLTDEQIATLTDSKVITNSLDENLNDIIANEITNTFDQDKYGYELNLGKVEVGEGESASQVWAEEIAVVRDVVEMSSNIEETDLSNEDTARSIGELLDASKESQILGGSTVSIADSILKDAYSGIEGYEAPEVDENTNFAEEFAKLQALLAAQGN